MVGLDRRDSRRKSRLHVEKPTAREEVAALEIGERTRVFTRKAQPRDNLRQKLFRCEGQVFQWPIVINRHYIKMPGEHDGFAALAALQGEHIGACVLVARNGIGSYLIEIPQEVSKLRRKRRFVRRAGHRRP